MLGVCLLAAGCGDDAAPASGSRTTGHHDASTGSRECYDPDGDGYGPYCELGKDCDEEDPDVTDLCYRCAKPNLDCPCEPGTEPEWCKPKDEKVEGGLIVCSDGTRYCRDGAWSDCERIAQYTMFVPDQP
jgi:hypothetical protein